MTEWMIAAIRNPHTGVLGHCTGRLLTGRGQRDHAEQLEGQTVVGMRFELLSRSHRCREVAVPGGRPGQCVYRNKVGLAFEDRITEQSGCLLGAERGLVREVTGVEVLRREGGTAQASMRV